jgi:hypothetical protein
MISEKRTFGKPFVKPDGVIPHSCLDPFLHPEDLNLISNKCQPKYLSPTTTMRTERSAGIRMAIVLQQHPQQLYKSRTPSWQLVSAMKMARFTPKLSRVTILQIFSLRRMAIRNSAWSAP